MRLLLAAALLGAGPVAAAEWQDMTAGTVGYAAGAWSAECDTGEPHGCTASIEVGADDGGPGRVSILWAEWGDEGYGMTVEAERMPVRLPDTITLSVEDMAMVLQNSADFFPAIESIEGPETGAAEIGEPMMLEDLTERMAVGTTLVWAWDDGAMAVPLAGFAEVFAAVNARRRAQFE